MKQNIDIEKKNYFSNVITMQNLSFLKKKMSKEIDRND